MVCTGGLPPRVASGTIAENRIATFSKLVKDWICNKKELFDSWVIRNYIIRKS